MFFVEDDPFLLGLGPVTFQGLLLLNFWRVDSKKWLQSLRSNGADDFTDHRQRRKSAKKIRINWLAIQRFYPYLRQRTGKKKHKVLIHGDTFLKFSHSSAEVSKKKYHQPTLALRVFFSSQMVYHFSVFFLHCLSRKKTQYKVGHLIPRRATEERCRKIRFLHRFF